MVDSFPYVILDARYEGGVVASRVVLIAVGIDGTVALMNDTPRPMNELAARAQTSLQGIADTLGSLPWWGALLVLFVPTLLALLSRRSFVSLATAILNAACMILIAPEIPPATAGVIGLTAISLVLVVFGFRERRREKEHAELAEHLKHVRNQMMVFLEALDRRTREVDERMRRAVAMEATAARSSGAARQTTTEVAPPVLQPASFAKAPPRQPKQPE